MNAHSKSQVVLLGIMSPNSSLAGLKRGHGKSPCSTGISSALQISHWPKHQFWRFHDISWSSTTWQTNRKTPPVRSWYRRWVVSHDESDEIPVDDRLPDDCHDLSHMGYIPVICRLKPKKGTTNKTKWTWDHHGIYSHHIPMTIWPLFHQKPPCLAGTNMYMTKRHVVYIYSEYIPTTFLWYSQEIPISNDLPSMFSIFVPYK